MSDDTKALVSGLERLSRDLNNMGYDASADTVTDAVDEIERLERELSEARGVSLAYTLSLSSLEGRCNDLLDELSALARERDALAERCEKLREALNQIAVLAEWQTSGPDANPRCKSDALSAGHATSLRGSISEIARAALAALKDGG